MKETFLGNMTAKEHTEITLKLLEERKRRKAEGVFQANRLRYEKLVTNHNRKEYKSCYGKKVKGYQR